MQSEAEKEKLYDRLARRIAVQDWRVGTGLDARALCAKHGMAWNGPEAAEQPAQRPAHGKAGSGVRVRKGLVKGGGPKSVALSATALWPQPASLSLLKCMPGQCSSAGMLQLHHDPRPACHHACAPAAFDVYR